ncbi:MAG: hypothetical protein RBT65_05280 [Methanolobus sp.]|jgi:hypothetical protein|nr:hypothetical protein [Methanolobus sp.]
MDKILLLAAAIFFLIVGLYNLYQTYKKKETYIPVIASFLMFFVTLIMYFSPVLGSLCLFLSMIILASKWPALKKYQQKRMLDSFNKNDYSEKLKIKDFLIGTKPWGRMALNYGAKKAAIIYSLCMSGSIFLFLYIIRTMDIFIKPDISFILIFSTTYLFASYYYMHGYFKKFFVMKENVSEKIN